MAGHTAPEARDPEPSFAAASAPIARAGENCWRIERAARAAFLIDGAATFDAIASAIERARSQVLIAAWDIDSRLVLRRGAQGPPETGDSPLRLGELLNQAARRGAHVYVLDWDWALVYAVEREILPIVELDWKTHRRVRFHLDDEHPTGASHHQKVVVVDDAIAFVGGLDLTARRWDTPEHRLEDPRRTDPWGHTYGPFHDAQMAVDGEAAAALGDLVRERWRRATGRRLRAPRRFGDPWPPGLETDLEAVEVAIARTEGAHGDREGVREIERLTVDAIRAARHAIYVENQYLTARSVGDALEEVLAAPQGPDVVVVSNECCGGWLEEATMGIRRARLLARLEKADHAGRLGVYAARQSGEEVKIHSKILVVDDLHVRVGSANLSSRSMGLDSECDLAIDARDERDRERIRGFRARLLAEHLGTTTTELEEALATLGSLRAAVESLRGRERTLKPISAEREDWLDELVPEETPFDPEHPIGLEMLLREPVVREATRGADRPFLRGALAAAIGAVLVFGLSLLDDRSAVESIEIVRDSIRGSAWAAALVVASYAAIGLIAKSITATNVATVLVFGPAAGFAFATVGALTSAVAMHLLGHALGRRRITRLGLPRLVAASRAFNGGSAADVAVVRLLSLAPPSLASLAAGAMGIALAPFTLGTLVALLPGAAAAALLGREMLGAIASPGWTSAARVALAAALLLGAAWFVRARVRERRG